MATIRPIMQAPRPEDVQAQVVAWHNRHPLARRIHASQVHSIGAVLLPFASAQTLEAESAPLPATAAAEPALRPDTPADPLTACAAPQPEVLAAASSAAAVPALGAAATQPDATAGRQAVAELAGGPETAAAAPDIVAVDFTDESDEDDANDGDDADELLIDIPDNAASADSSEVPEADAEAATVSGDDAEATAERNDHTSADHEASPSAPSATDEQTSVHSTAPVQEAHQDSSAQDSSAPASAQASAQAAVAHSGADDAGAEDAAGGAADSAADRGQPPEASAFADLDAADAAEAAEVAAAAAQAAQAQAPTFEAPATDGPGAGAGGAASDPAITGPAEPAAEALTPLGERLQAARQRALETTDTAPDAAEASATTAARPASQAQPATAAATGTVHGLWQPWLRRLLQRLPHGRHGAAVAAAMGMASSAAAAPASLRSVFSRDFIWPLSIGQVARWAQRHGSTVPVAPADWPLRVVETDPGLLRKRHDKGFKQPVLLHVMTAAIGVGDRRIRLLLDAQGHIIGPRAYDRRRVGGLASVAMALLLVSAGLWRPPANGVDALAADDGAATAVAAASAAEAASQAEGDASANLHPAAAQAHEPDHGPASATAHDSLAAIDSSQTDAHGAPQGLSAKAEPAEVGATHAATPATANDSAPGAAADLALGAAAAASQPALALGRVRPSLSDEQRQQALLQSRQMRANPHPPTDGLQAPPGPVFAVVTSPQARREQAASSLNTIASARARLPPPAPDQTDLMGSEGQWRAVWWPFANRADAERARVMLLVRGLRAEVVGF